MCLLCEGMGWEAQNQVGDGQQHNQFEVDSLPGGKLVYMRSAMEVLLSWAVNNGPMVSKKKKKNFGWTRDGCMDCASAPAFHCVPAMEPHQDLTIKAACQGCHLSHTWAAHNHGLAFFAQLLESSTLWP